MQKINLYQVEPEPESIVCSLTQIIQVSVLMMIVLAIFSVYQLYSNYKQNHQFKQLQLQKSSLNQGLQTAKQQSPTDTEREKLIKQIAHLEKNYIVKEKMYRTLSQLQYGESQGFARYFSALAKHSSAGIWLTNIDLISGGSLINLAGMTSDSKFVPELIKSLGKDNSFRGKNFEVFKVNNIVNPDNDENYITFEVSSK